MAKQTQTVKIKVARGGGHSAGKGGSRVIRKG